MVSGNISGRSPLGTVMVAVVLTPALTTSPVRLNGALLRGQREYTIGMSARAEPGAITMARDTTSKAVPVDPGRSKFLISPSVSHRRQRGQRRCAAPA